MASHTVAATSCNPSQLLKTATDSLQKKNYVFAFYVLTGEIQEPCKAIFGFKTQVFPELNRLY